MIGLETLGPHAGFIVAAYAVTAAVVLGLIAWVVADQRTQSRRLAVLESRATPRRQPAPARATDAKAPAEEPV